MKVAIVILNWNGEKMLAQYLPSVVHYTSDDAEIFVADNASTDGSLKLLTEHFPSVKQIVLDKNWGFAEGYNKALKLIDAEYYLLLNSDIEVTHNWLAPLLEFMDVLLMTKINLNMQVLPVVFLIVSDILFAEVVFLKWLKMIMDNMMISARFLGLLELV